MRCQTAAATMSSQTVSVAAYNRALIESDFPPEYYAQNTFALHDPEYGFKWLQEIKPENGKNLAKIKIFVPQEYTECPRECPYSFPVLPPPHSNGTTWYLFLETLRQQAPNVREIDIYLEAETSMGYFGAGADVKFVRALGRFEGLEVLKLDGYYAKEWPAYLEQKTGIGVCEVPEQKKSFYLTGLREFQSMCNDLSP